MREKKDYIVLTFSTTSQAMEMEKRCGELGVPGRLIPIPTSITAGCGLAWRITPEEYESFEEILQNLKIPFEKTVRIRL